MKEVYEKLIENLASMTPEEKEKEWEILKSYNEIGPEVKELERIIVCLCKAQRLRSPGFCLCVIKKQ